MRKFRKLPLLCTIIAAMGASIFNADAAQSKMAKPPAMSEPLTSKDLVKLYGNHSWIWKDGAGYFAVKQREFKAWTGEGAGSYGTGHWFVTDPGKLCFKAMWYAKTGKADALTCFSHRKKGNTIFQKREPNGEWYAFKTSPGSASDEYRKVQAGDYATARFDRMRTKLSPTR
ncbi:DUF995 domain-containing protein [Phyllobacterium bourgognense]|uniref:Uncharacterized protein DUF995 n=1 Tax=Phyllobacterium bourgognense TaxID=314236 RepID=A0A368YMN7_9HYPH|nr:DUF995 domain-containing protein [Phyllobacterium bourgognense]RCW80859.1 uncharacterized protein DUF995 [Phyllobacterium bourgognense]